MCKSLQRLMDRGSPDSLSSLAKVVKATVKNLNGLPLNNCLLGVNMQHDTVL